MARMTVFGASGMIGSRVLTEALNRGHDVLAVTRDSAKLTRAHPGLRVTFGDVLEIAGGRIAHASTEDFVVAVVDEVELERHVRQRFAVGH